MSASDTNRDRANFTSINDAVFEFYRPAVGDPEVEILFFHGMRGEKSGDAFWDTWMMADGSSCWLNSMLPERFPQSRILSISYDSCTEKTDCTGRLDMFLVAENLLQNIVDLAAVGQKCPVVMVGHCIGGLVLKAVCCKAEEEANSRAGVGVNRYETFLRMIKGAFFFSTPQFGSRAYRSLGQPNPLMPFFETFLRMMKGAILLRTSQSRSRAYSSLGQPSPLMLFFEVLNSESARLNASFSSLRKCLTYQWRTAGVSEANAMDNFAAVVQPAGMTLEQGWTVNNAMVVEEGSARYDLDKYCVLSGENSSSICKPKSRRSTSFQHFEKFIEDTLRGVKDLKEWQFSLKLPLVLEKMPNRVQKVIEILKLDQAEPSRVCLAGMGGIGKSTLAKQVLMVVLSQFDFVSFVENVRKRFNGQNLNSLIVESLYYGNGQKVAGGEHSLWSLLRGKKAMIILDNIDSEQQLRIPDCLAVGSRLLVTSSARLELHSFVTYQVPLLVMAESRELLIAHTSDRVQNLIPPDLIDEVAGKCGGLPLALEVIGSYLGCKEDIWTWKEASERLRRAESVSGDANDRLVARLRVSFEDLAPQEQKIFLDLALFDDHEPGGVKYDAGLWGAFWRWESGLRGCDFPITSLYTGLKNLEDRFFITVTDVISEEHRGLTDMYVSMHDQLRAMGRNELRPPNKDLRECAGICQPGDVRELHNLCKGNGSEMKAEKLVCNGDLGLPIQWQFYWPCIGNLPRLRLLRMSNMEFVGNGPARFSCSLAWLHLLNCSRGRTMFRETCQVACWPIRAQDVGYLHKLRVLVLEDCKCVRFPHNFHELSNLRILIINQVQVLEFPTSLPSLHVLRLRGISLTDLTLSGPQCSSLRILEIVDCPSFKGFRYSSVAKSALLARTPRGLPSMLTTLVFEQLPCLTTLPAALFMELQCLQKLRIWNCDALRELPEGIWRCRHLTRVELGTCYHLGSEGRLRSVKQSERGMRHNTERSSADYLADDAGHYSGYVKFWQLRSLRALPENMGDLLLLEKVSVTDIPNLETLPESLGNLHQLKSFILLNLPALRSIPESIGNLQSLRYLYLNNLPNLRRLPGNIGSFRNLRILRLLGLSSIQNLPEYLISSQDLLWLKLQDLPGIMNLPKSLGNLQSLTQLSLSGLPGIISLAESLGNLKSLRHLKLSDLPGIVNLPETLGSLHSLKWLTLSGLPGVTKLPESLGNLQSLPHLILSGLWGIVNIPESLGNLESLTELSLLDLPGIVNLPESLGNLQTLTHLTLSSLSRIVKLPESFGNLQSLTQLSLSALPGLVSLPESLGNLQSLTRLDISSLPAVVTCQDLSARCRV